LKGQKDKKETLEGVVGDIREVHGALTSAHEALEEANVFAEEQAAAAAAPTPAYETPDLFSWDSPPAPAPAPVYETEPATAPSLNSDEASSVAGVPAAANIMVTLTSDSTSSALSDDLTPSMQSAIHASMMNHHVADDASQHTFNSHMMFGAPDANGGMGGPSPQINHEQPQLTIDPNHGFTPMGGSVSGAPPMGDIMGGPSPTMTPMGMGGPEATPTNVINFSSMQSAPSSFTTQGSVVSQHGSEVSQQPPPPPPPPPPPQQLVPKSPEAAEVESMKKDALRAEQMSHSSQDLVHTLTREVEKLDNKAKRAESEAKGLEAVIKTKGRMGGKKKAKQNYERAKEYAMGERKKASDAQSQLGETRREASKAKKEAENLRQQYEQAELDVATANSVMSANSAANSAAQPSAHVSPVGNASYADPFGGSSYQSSAATTSDPYGMQPMGGSNPGNYPNPFAMG